MLKEFAGRIVAFVVTPVVGGLAAWFAPWAAEHLPGAPNFDPAQLTLIGVSGAVIVGGAAYKWLDNLGKHERLKAQLEAAKDEESPINQVGEV